MKEISIRGSKNFCLWLLMLVSLSCGSANHSSGSNPPKGFISFDDARIQYEGRIGKNKREAAELYWSGSAARIRFQGTGMKALLEDYNGQNYFNIIIDGTNIRKVKIDSAKHWYLLAENLSPGEHVVELFKLTQINQEYKRGYTRFYGFQPENGEVLPAPALKKRKIEFYGNSITCGHAVEDTSGADSGASMFENNYLSYAAITARHFNAQYSCIAVSGIGLMAGFRKLIMPEMYYLRNPFDSTDRWNFSLYTPDVVVVNLLQNDEGVIGRPDSEPFKRRFGSVAPSDEFIIDAYKSFISKLRSHYPVANIICVLGNMGITRTGSKWPGLVQEATRQLSDQKVHTLFFKYKGTPGHPNRNEQKTMADSLINFIQTTTHWDK
ncbi:MAG TPA: SGNH/GDSL hydrolase family protein [Flavitalea sp.]|nr:SGNH/GDSL hydrolase family protein [Flavitalea sp.]